MELKEGAKPLHREHYLVNGFAGLLRRNWRTSSAAVAMCTDALIVSAAFVLASILTERGLLIQDVLYSHRNLILFSLLAFLGFYTALGLYRTIATMPLNRQLFIAARGYVYGIAVILSALFLKQNLFYSRGFLLVYFMLIPGLYLITWIALRRLAERLGRSGFGRWNTLVIGPDGELRTLLDRLEDHPELGYDVAQTIATPPRNNGSNLVHVERRAVEEALGAHPIQLIVFSSSQLNGSFDELEDLCRTSRIPMRVVSLESDTLVYKARLHDLAGIPLFSPARQKIDFLKRVAKRAFDIAGSILALLLLSPLFLLVAAATKLESRGPVFFKQKRALSDHTQPFQFYKFRSMHHLADEQKTNLFHRNESNGALFKMKNDPRLTKIGRIIRRYSIDELPQLLNVLRGDMSLVGPRPLPVDDFRRLQEEDHLGGYYRHRANSKPGMTGLWQISGRSDLGFREMVLLDLYYIENQTILFDLEILAQTVPVVLFGKGAY